MKPRTIERAEYEALIRTGHKITPATLHAFAAHRTGFNAYCVLEHAKIKSYHWNSFRHYLDLAADLANPKESHQ